MLEYFGVDIRIIMDAWHGKWKVMDITNQQAIHTYRHSKMVIWTR